MSEIFSNPNFFKNLSMATNSPLSQEGLTSIRVGPSMTEPTDFNSTTDHNLVNSNNISDNTDPKSLMSSADIQSPRPPQPIDANVVVYKNMPVPKLTGPSQQQQQQAQTDAKFSDLGMGNHVDSAVSATATGSRARDIASDPMNKISSTSDFGSQFKPLSPSVGSQAGSSMASTASSLGSSFIGGMGFGLASSAISGLTGLIGKGVDQANWQSRYDTVSSSMNDIGVKPGYAMVGTGGRLGSSLTPAQSVSGSAMNTSSAPGGATSPSQGMFSQALGIGSL